MHCPTIKTRELMKMNGKGPRNGRRQSVFESKEDCIKKLADYFGEFLTESGEIADIESLADYLGITRETLIRLRDSAEYGDEIKKAYNRIAKIKKQLAFAGKLPATVLSFDMRNNHGYKDKQEQSGDEAGTVIFRGKAAAWAK